MSAKPLTVQFSIDSQYPLLFTEDVFAPDNPTLHDALGIPASAAAPPRIRVFVDAGLAAAQPDLTDRILSYGRARLPAMASESPAILPGGEEIKNDIQHVERVITDLAERRFCRHSYVVAVGGGAFLDAVGFAAALLHRGVRLVRIPSTTLSQDDSGVGTKNGINGVGQKNLLGTFMPPWAVINDSTLLRTLSRDLVLDGVAEAFKVAIIKDADFFAFLEAHSEELADPASQALHTAVRRSAELHADHIMTNGDPFEKGTARPLDFGHWAAHRLEAMSEYRIRHGQGVGIGIAVDAAYAGALDLLSIEERDRIHDALRRTGLATWDPLLEERDGNGRLRVFAGIAQFREHLGGQLAVTFPNPIGQRIELPEIDEQRMEAAIRAVKS